MGRDAEYVKRVGVALETIRVYRRMSQAALASEAGTSESTVSRYERGETDKVDSHVMVGLADALRVPVEMLIRPPEYREEVLLALGHYEGRRRADEPEPS